MLNALAKVGQIAAGVVVGLVANDAMEKYVLKPIQKVVEAKKAES